MQDIISSPEIVDYIRFADEFLSKNVLVGYNFSDHGTGHVSRVSLRASALLKALSYDEHTQELCRIACALHDIGNLISREDHAQYGAILAFSILREAGMHQEDIGIIVNAISNHDEKYGIPASSVAAALVIADKTDIGKIRTRSALDNKDIYSKSEHAILGETFQVDSVSKSIRFAISLDNSICSVIEYVVLQEKRFLICEYAARVLDCMFELYINGIRMN